MKVRPAKRAATIQIAMIAIDTSDNQRTLAKSSNHWLMPRLATTPIAFAKRWPNMSMNAFASYFSSGDVGVYSASFADWLIE